MMSDLMVTGFAPARPPAGRAASDYPVAALRAALRICLTRRALPELSARELADIGVTRGEALAEAARLPWDTAPGPRRRPSAGVAGVLERALERARTRRLLARMQIREMRDIGVSLCDAQTEASKPCWQR